MKASLCLSGDSTPGSSPALAFFAPCTTQAPLAVHRKALPCTLIA